MALIGKQNLSLSPRGEAWQIISFIIDNPTNVTVTISLFNSNTAVPVNTTPTSARNKFCIESSSTDYNQFVRDKSVNPKIMKQIVLITSSEQLAKPLRFAYTNMIGVLSISPRHPNLGITQYMPQSTISSVDFNDGDMDSVLDEHTEIRSYKVLANTTLTMVIYYKELIRDHMLDMSFGTKLITCDKLEVSNCSEDNVDKLASELVNFGEPVITMDEILATENINKINI